MNMEEQYLSSVLELVQKAEQVKLRDDRTNTGTYSFFARHWRCNLQEGFPLLTTKFVAIRPIIHELLWFLAGSTNNDDLRANDVHIWDQWALEDGSLGPVYGKQWRSWDAGGYVIDQIAELIAGLKQRPFSRRHIVSAWNPADLPDESHSPKDNAANGKMALAPCHCLFQFYVEDMLPLERFNYMRSLDGLPPVSQVPENFEDKAVGQLTARAIPSRKLSCQLYQRSADIMVGVPFNIASYALLTMMVAQVVDMAPGEFIHTFGDLHMYATHLEGAREQLERTVLPMPRMRLNPAVKNIDEFKYEDFTLEGYVHHRGLKFDVAY